MIQNIKLQIHNLVEKYKQNRDFYRKPNFNETELRNQFLDPFFEILGWDIRNTSRKNTNEREVLLEESLKPNASSHSKKPDYTFRLYGERKFFLEAKKPYIHIDSDNEPAKQIRRYGFTAGLKISVLSNFEDLYIYDTSIPVEDSDSNSRSRIKTYHYTDYEDSAEELLNFLGKESVYSGHFEEEWKDISLNVEHKSIDKLFLEQINEWRLMLGNDIYKIDPTIDINYLGDIVQSYINKILFLRVCEDRNIETYQILLNIADQDNYEGLIAKFKDADKKYNSGLFEAKLSDNIICNISSSFWTIIRQLYYPESPYSFTVLSSDILGRIYEIFLAQKLDVHDGKLIIVNKPENIERDIVTTPNYIVREILRQTASEIVKDKNNTQINELKCADIACGSGAFLLELYQLLYDALIDYYIANDKSKLIQTNVDSYKLPYETKRELLTNCIFGVDKDFNAVEACKFGLLLKLLEDEDVNSLSEVRPILPDLNNNIFFGNSLLDLNDVPQDQQEEINPFDFGDMKYDLIVGNPPYMKTEDIKKFTPNEKKLYEEKNRYVCAYKQYDKYFLFVERAINLLKENGYLGYIIPSKFMKVGAASALRNLIAENKYLKSLTSFGANQVFEGKSNYTCIMILEKNQHDIFKYSEVEKLETWKVRSEDAHSLCYRSTNLLSDKTWVLYTDKHKHLVEQVLYNTKTLEEIVGKKNIFNGIQTSAEKVYVFVPTNQDESTFTFTAFDGKTYQIEKDITKPYYKQVQSKDALSLYRTFTPNARVIFPYKRDKDGKLSLIKLDKIEKEYPLFYQFLKSAKSELATPNRSILPKPATQEEWYRYGRHQGLEACEIKEKIIVGVLSQSERYAIDKEGTLVSSGGTAGCCLISIPSNCKYSIFYIQALLGSRQGEWLASLYGEIFRGGYIARGTKVLKQIPIKLIDFNNPYETKLHDEIVDRQKKLIALGDKIASIKANNCKINLDADINARQKKLIQATEHVILNNQRRLIPLQRKFDSLKQEQQCTINKLYGMTEQDASQIPVIKNIYAVD